MMTVEHSDGVASVIERAGQAITDAGDLSQLAWARRAVLDKYPTFSVEVLQLHSEPGRVMITVSAEDGTRWSRTFTPAPKSWG